jgi:hypothetical protein
MQLLSAETESTGLKIVSSWKLYHHGNCIIMEIVSSWKLYHHGNCIIMENQLIMKDQTALEDLVILDVKNVLADDVNWEDRVTLGVKAILEEEKPALEDNIMLNVKGDSSVLENDPLG